mmetsp:Transcript_45527/g.110778  ORF Transcript_45527/g.110778 Transcript_45527/m.110778 type:complete len:1105 (+) Transcript_45527:320-3634(+)
MSFVFRKFTKARSKNKGKQHKQQQQQPQQHPPSSHQTPQIILQKHVVVEEPSPTSSSSILKNSTSTTTASVSSKGPLHVDTTTIHTAHHARGDNNKYTSNHRQHHRRGPAGFLFRRRKSNDPSSLFAANVSSSTTTATPETATATASHSFSSPTAAGASARGGGVIATPSTVPLTVASNYTPPDHHFHHHNEQHYVQRGKSNTFSEIYDPPSATPTTTSPGATAGVAPRQLIYDGVDYGEGENDDDEQPQRHHHRNQNQNQNVKRGRRPSAVNNSNSNNNNNNHHHHSNHSNHHHGTAGSTSAATAESSAGSGSGSRNRKHHQPHPHPLGAAAMMAFAGINPTSTSKTTTAAGTRGVVTRKNSKKAAVKGHDVDDHILNDDGMDASGEQDRPPTSVVAEVRRHKNPRSPPTTKSRRSGNNHQRKAGGRDGGGDAQSVISAASYSSMVSSQTQTSRLSMRSAGSKAKAMALQREAERTARAASSLDTKGNALFEKGQYDKAMSCYAKALKLKRRTFAHLLEEADDLLEEEQLLGYVDEDDDDDSEDIDGGLGGIIGRIDENETMDDDDVKNNSGVGFQQMNHPQRYQNKAAATAAAATKSKATADPQVLVSMATSINNIGYLRQRSGDATPDETMAAYEKSLRIKRRILGNDSLSVGKTLNNLGSVHYLKHEFGQAQEAYSEALLIMETNLGSDHPDVATVRSNIGDVHLAQKHIDEALQQYRKALRIRWEAFGERDPRVKRLLEKIAKVEIGEKMPSSADAVRNIMSATMDPNARPKWTHLPPDDEETNELLDLGMKPIAEEFHLLNKEMTKEIEHVNWMERRATVQALKDKITIIRGMREVGEGYDVYDIIAADEEDIKATATEHTSTSALQQDTGAKVETTAEEAISNTTTQLPPESIHSSESKSNGQNQESQNQSVRQQREAMLQEKRARLAALRARRSFIPSSTKGDSTTSMLTVSKSASSSSDETNATTSVRHGSKLPSAGAGANQTPLSPNGERDLVEFYTKLAGVRVAPSVGGDPLSVGMSRKRVPLSHMQPDELKGEVQNIKRQIKLRRGIESLRSSTSAPPTTLMPSPTSPAKKSTKSSLSSPTSPVMKVAPLQN